MPPESDDFTKTRSRNYDKPRRPAFQNGPRSRSRGVQEMTRKRQTRKEVRPNAALFGARVRNCRSWWGESGRNASMGRLRRYEKGASRGVGELAGYLYSSGRGVCFEIEVFSESAPWDQDAGISELGGEWAGEGQLEWRGVSARDDVISACKWSATMFSGIHSRYGGWASRLAHWHPGGTSVSHLVRDVR